MKYFKAKIPFSSGNGIYNPSDAEPGKAPKEVVDSWIEAGYCVEVEAPKIKIIINNPIEPPEEPHNEQDEQPAPIMPDEVKTPENEENEQSKDEIDAMSYPQLKKAAKEAGIKGYNTMKQADLIKVLRGE